jgi:REP element-mobilizing transposase RayT
MGQTLTSLNFHIVLATKKRAPLLSDSLLAKLLGKLGDFTALKKSKVIAKGGTSNHIHFLVKTPPNVSVTDLMRTVKAKSAAWVKETFPDAQNFGWQSGYAAYSVSHSNIDSVKTYFEMQAKHHEKMDWKQEIIMFAKKHGIRYDESYL